MARFEKGQSGNPRGRPKKGQTFTDILKGQGELLDVSIKDPNTGESTPITRKEAISDKLWRLALAGDVAAIRYIYDRVDGRPMETAEINGKNGGALIVKFEKEYEGL